MNRLLAWPQLPKHIRFMIGWVSVWVFSLFVATLVSTVGWSVFAGQAVWTFFGNLLGFCFLALAQARLVKHFFDLALGAWLSLAVIGFCVGQIALRIFQTNVDHVFPPVILGIGHQDAGANVAWLRYILYSSIFTLLAWYTPLIFQWFALRKRFQRHALWLLAIVFCAPLGFLVPNMFYGGIFEKAFELLTGASGHPLEWIVIVLDWLTPPTLMGIALLYITQGRKAVQPPPAAR